MEIEGTIGFIGAGNMADALVRGVLTQGVVTPQQLWATNRSNRERLEGLQQRYGVSVTRHKASLAEVASILIIAVKPADMADVLGELAAVVRNDHLVISVAAGIPLRTIEQALPSIAAVRAMPNTSAAVGASATVLAAGRRATVGHLDQAAALFRAVGDVVTVEEELLDVITGLSGSGPAYVYHLIEAMIQAGVEMGLDADLARRLTVQTLVGAARMLTESRVDPGELRRRVTSPGGTTMAALRVLEDRGVAHAIRDAIDRAAIRARELAEEYG